MEKMQKTQNSKCSNEWKIYLADTYLLKPFCKNVYGCFYKGQNRYF